MPPVYDQHGITVLHGDCLDVLAGLPDSSVDAVVTDPPYGLGNPDPAYVIKALERWFAGDRAHVPDSKGFMGRAWDAFVPPPAVWDECLRVLKPGGHLLCFSAPRTVDLMTLSIRLAGFEIRDNLAWHFGSGFPKSLDVGKAIDKSRQGRDDILRFTAWMRERCAALGLKARDLDIICGTNGMGSHWTSNKSQPYVPTAEQFALLRPTLGDPPADLACLVLPARQPGEAWEQREVIGEWNMPGRGSRSAVQAYGLTNDHGTITAPATDAARQWSGFGTALKPAHEPVVVAQKPASSAHEPIVMARKPLSGTVAANVTEHGTGALNIEACRVNPGTPVTGGGGWSAHKVDSTEGWDRPYVNGVTKTEAHTSGRWPSNVVFTHSPNCADECAPGCPVAELDAQSGNRPGFASQTDQADNKTDGTTTYGAGIGSRAGYREGYNDSGGASRFFAQFRYTADDQAFFPVESSTWELPGARSTRDASTSAGRNPASTNSVSPTDGSGSRSTETSPRATRSTTGITTPSTTTSATSCASPLSGTTTTTSGSARNTDGSTASSSDAASASPASSGSRPTTSTSAVPGPSTATARNAPRPTDASGLPATATPSTLADVTAQPEDSPPEFFPVFRYQAKAPASERPKVNGIAHSTVKPLTLMSWLVRLVTPPGGVVLDPFLGSGTTAQAARDEGFRCIGIEREAEYLDLIRARLDRPPPTAQRVEQDALPFGEDAA